MEKIINPTIKKCFGIPSYLPETEPDRSERIERLNRMFDQLNTLFPTVDFLIIAQNWKDYKVPSNIKDRCIIKSYAPLGILKARQELRNEFLETDYGYIIMADDDLIVECDDKEAPDRFLKAMDNNPNGFCP